MASIWQRTRLAGVVGAALALLATGIVAGAAGDAIIMGTANSAGTTNTSLTTSSTGTAFYVTQAGTGTAMRANTTGPNAIAGFYTSGDGPGISGVTAHKDQYAVYAGNDAATTGSGAALRVAGKNNMGIVVNSTGTYGIDAYGWDAAIRATATGCSDPGCNSAYGVIGTGLGQAYGGGFIGYNGLLGQSFTPGGVGVYGVGYAASYALFGDGDAAVLGDLTVTGAKTGYVADYAINGGKVTLHQGDAVTLLDVKPAAVGAIPLLVVGPARAGDTVIGIVDRAMTPHATTISAPPPLATVATPARDAEAAFRGFTASGPEVAPGKHLLVVTLGAFAYGSADASAGAIKAGDQLMAGATPGRLTKAAKVTVSGRSFTVPGTSVGYALGALADGFGRIGIFVSPH